MCILDLFSFSCFYLKVSIYIYIYRLCFAQYCIHILSTMSWLNAYMGKTQIIIESLKNNETCDCWNVKYEIFDNKFPSKKKWPFFFPSIILIAFHIFWNDEKSKFPLELWGLCSCVFIGGLFIGPNEWIHVTYLLMDCTHASWNEQFK
jgi:hypothetical protein